MTKFPTAVRARHIRYAVRDIVLVARQAQQSGLPLRYLNIGDPLQFDFQTPAHIVEAICSAIRANHNGYAPSEGLPEALEAVRAQSEADGLRQVQDVYIGNGASECAEVALAALVDPGDNVLVPSPGYPLYSALLAKLGCVERAYALDESNGWQPDAEAIAEQIDARTRVMVLINPNNPTGSVCTEQTLRALLELAARHDLVVIADEIYERLVLDGKPVRLASLDTEVPILTLSGLSKAYLGPGLRLGWCITSGPAQIVAPIIDAMHKFIRARLCANHPVQYAVKPALMGDQSHLSVVIDKLRRRRDRTVAMLNATPGVNCVSPRAAFYAFPRLLDLPGGDDTDFVHALIRATGVVVVPGAGFGQAAGSNHFRLVFLPEEEVLEAALGLVADFLSTYRR